MARLHASIPPPRLSVLDRLMDDEPDVTGPEALVDYHTGLAAMRKAVLRDLQWLLNARIQGHVGVDRDDPCAETVVRLGLPDITNLDLKNDNEREALRRRIADTIARFEPRLDFVSVEARRDEEDRGRTRFHIEGRLRVDPEPMKLSFDATVVWRNRTVEVR